MYILVNGAYLICSVLPVYAEFFKKNTFQLFDMNETGEHLIVNLLLICTSHKCSSEYLVIVMIKCPDRILQTDNNC